jgi:hypothetical protein
MREDQNVNFEIKSEVFRVSFGIKICLAYMLFNTLFDSRKVISAVKEMIKRYFRIVFIHIHGKFYVCLKVIKSVSFF